MSVLGVLKNDLVVKSIKNYALVAVPKQVVMGTSESIIARDNFWTELFSLVALDSYERGCLLKCALKRMLVLDRDEVIICKLLGLYPGVVDLLAIFYVFSSHCKTLQISLVIK